MATYLSQTSSNRPRLTNPIAVMELLEEWGFLPNHGELVVRVAPDDNGNGVFVCYGEADFQPYPKDAPDHPDERYEFIDQETFLDELAPHLLEDLVIQTIGWTKLRFPFVGNQYVVDAQSGEVHTESFYEQRERLLEGKPDEP